MKRILIIDDDVKLLKLMRRWLEGDGYEVIQALDGGIAMELQRQTSADLIITDIFMPEKEGTELIMELRKEFPLTKIIAISGGGSVKGVDFLQLTENLGAQRAIRKPFGKEELLGVVEEVL